MNPQAEYSAMSESSPHSTSFWLLQVCYDKSWIFQDQKSNILLINTTNQLEVCFVREPCNIQDTRNVFNSALNFFAHARPFAISSLTMAGSGAFHKERATNHCARYSMLCCQIPHFVVLNVARFSWTSYSCLLFGTDNCGCSLSSHL